MFCPKCKYEYRAGVKECHDCQVSLVAELIEETEAEPQPVFVEYKEMLFTMYPEEVALMKSDLDKYRIDYRFDIEAETQKATLMVRTDQYREAARILDESAQTAVKDEPRIEGDSPLINEPQSFLKEHRSELIVVGIMLSPIIYILVVKIIGMLFK